MKKESHMWSEQSLKQNTIYNMYTVLIIHIVWSANDGAARDLSKTLQEPVSIKKTKSVVFPLFSNPKLTVWLEIQLIWAFCQKADVAGSRWIPASLTDLTVYH